MLPVMTDRNKMLNLKMLSSLEPVLVNSWLTDPTFHIRLSMGIMQKPLSKHQMNLITLQEVSALVACLFLARFSHDGKFM